MIYMAFFSRSRKVFRKLPIRSISATYWTDCQVLRSRVCTPTTSAQNLSTRPTRPFSTWFLFVGRSYPGRFNKMPLHESPDFSAFSEDSLVSKIPILFRPGILSFFFFFVRKMFHHRGGVYPQALLRSPAALCYTDGSYTHFKVWFHVFMPAR